MELPYNTTISGDLLKGGGQFADPWPAGPPSAAGCRTPSPPSSAPVTSAARTCVGDPAKTKFVYRDRLWRARTCWGSASRRSATSTACTCRTTPGEVPGRHRARRNPARPRLPPTDEERLIREFVLQLKRGAIRPSHFAESMASTSDRFRAALASLRHDGYLADLSADRIALTREGLMRVATCCSASSCRSMQASGIPDLRMLNLNSISS